MVRDGVFFRRRNPRPPASHPSSGPERDAACDAKFLELLAAVEEQGSYVNESVHPAATRRRSSPSDPATVTSREAEFTRAMRRLFEAKRIKVVVFGAPSKGQRKIIDVQADLEPDAQPAKDIAPETPTPPSAPPTKGEIDATITTYIKLDDGERALQRVATADRLGNMPLKVFDALVKVALKTTPAQGGIRPGSGRPKTDETAAAGEKSNQQRITAETLEKTQKSAEK